MKHLLSRRKNPVTPEYLSEVKALQTLIAENGCHKGSKKYFDFSKKCNTSVGVTAKELGKAINNYKHGNLSEEQVANKFRCTLDLIDYYLTLKK